VNDTEVIPQASGATVLDTGASPEFLCQVEEEQCTNGTDDDGDGLADCEDPECCDEPACFGIQLCSGISETLVSRQAVMDDAVVSGGFAGTLDFTSFEIVSMTTGVFAGKGFSTGECTVTLDGTDYSGAWKGVLFFDAQEKRIHLRGAVSGGIQAAVEGYLSESTSKNAIYDRYEATWSIGRLGGADVSSIINMDGTLSYQGGSEYVDTNLYVMQDDLEATDSGDYGDSLNMVLTHLRVVGPGNPYAGEGLSFSSYVSESGSGSIWTYDERVGPGTVDSIGLSGAPLFGIVSAVLDETSLPRSLELSIERVDLALPPMPDLRVSTWGPSWVSPGQTIDLTVAFSNNGADIAEEVVVVLELQDLSQFVSCTGGGIYRWQTHEVFWKLGTLTPGERGLLSAKVYFPWGLEAHTFHPALAHYVSASTDKYHYLNPDYEDLVDPQELHDYQPLRISSSEVLPPEDFGDLFESDEKFRQLHEDSMGQGFADASATKMATSDGPVTMVLMGKEADKMRFLINTEDESMIMEMTEKEVSFFDRDVGIAIDLDDGTTEVWGEEGTRRALEDTKAVRACLILKYCIDNCVFGKLPGWLLKHVIKPYGLYDNLADCAKCTAGQGAEHCTKCFGFMKKVPLLGQIIDILKCGHECRQNREKFCCTEDKRVCKVKWTSSREYIDIYKCDQETGLIHFFAWSKECGRCETCQSGRCVPRPSGYCSECYKSVSEPGYAAVSPSGEEGSGAGILNSYPYSDTCNEIITAHDPNIKYGPAGPVAAGQQLDYKLEYENEGEGTAFGVYFTDTLDTDLDDATLEVGPVKDVTDDTVIGPEGTYNPASRTVTWFAGEVGPGEGGYAEMSIDVRSDAPRSLSEYAGQAGFPEKQFCRWKSIASK